MTNETDYRLRIGDAERSAASTELGEHYAQGRLTTEEHADRLDRIWTARTRADLAPVFADLPARPGQPVSAPPAARPARRRTPWRGLSGLPTPMVVLLVVLLAIGVAAAWPWLLIGAGVWFFFLRGGGCRSSHRTHRW